MRRKIGFVFLISLLIAALLAATALAVSASTPPHGGARGRTNGPNAGMKADGVFPQSPARGVTQRPAYHAPAQALHGHAAWNAPVLRAASGGPEAGMTRGVQIAPPPPGEPPRCSAPGFPDQLTGLGNYALLSSPGGAAIPLYLKPDDNAALIGLYHSGVQVVTAGQTGDFTLVTIGDRPHDIIRGYVRTACLAEGPSDRGVVSAIPVAKLASDSPLYAEPTETAAWERSCREGLRVEVWGKTGDWAHVSVGGKKGFVPADALRVTDERAPALKDWEGGIACGLYFTLEEGTHVVGRDMPAGLYDFRAPGAGCGSVEAFGAPDMPERGKSQDTYTVYLPAGSTVRILAEGTLLKACLPPLDPRPNLPAEALLDRAALGFADATVDFFLWLPPQVDSGYYRLNTDGPDENGSGGSHGQPL